MISFLDSIPTIWLIWGIFSALILISTLVLFLWTHNDKMPLRRKKILLPLLVIILVISFVAVFFIAQQSNTSHGSDSTIQQSSNDRSVESVDAQEDTYTPTVLSESSYDVIVLKDGTCAILKCSGEDEIIDVPNTIQNMTVTQILSNAFTESPARTIRLPTTITRIDSFAFSNCPNLTRIIFAEGLTSVGELIINDCPMLISVIFPNSLTQVDGAPIGRCEALEAVYIPSSITEFPTGIAVIELCPKIVVYTPVGSAAEAVALEAGLPVVTKTYGGAAPSVDPTDTKTE